MTYDDKIIECFRAVCVRTGEGASPDEVTQEMHDRKWLSPLDTVIDIADIMKRLRFKEGRF
jgi:hypothetical protein